MAGMQTTARKQVQRPDRDLRRTEQRPDRDGLGQGEPAGLKNDQELGG